MKGERRKKEKVGREAESQTQPGSPRKKIVERVVEVMQSA